MITSDHELLKILNVRSAAVANLVIGVAYWDTLQEINYSGIRGCCSERSIWHGSCDTRGDITKDGLLITGEEEGFVFYDGPSKGPTELVALDLVLRRRCPIPRIEDPIAHELKPVSVELIAARSGDDIYNSAGILAVLRAVIAGLHTEFLQCVRHGKRLVDVGVFVDVIAAVKLITNLVLARAVRRDSDRARKGFGRALVGPAAGSLDRACNCQS